MSFNKLVVPKMQKLSQVTLSFQIQKRKNGYYFGDRFKFQYHIENLCKKTSLNIDIQIHIGATNVNELSQAKNKTSIPNYAYVMRQPKK